MLVGLLILQMLVGLGYLVCFIIVLIKQFQNAGAIHGIIVIVTCGIWTLIWGWRNADKPGLKRIMWIWTFVFLICLILNSVFGPAMMRYYGVEPLLP